MISKGLSVFAIGIGSLLLGAGITQMGTRGADQLVSSMPVIIAGGLIALAISERGEAG